MKRSAKKDFKESIYLNLYIFVGALVVGILEILEWRSLSSYLKAGCSLMVLIYAHTKITLQRTHLCNYQRALPLQSSQRVHVPFLHGMGTSLVRCSSTSSPV